MAIGDHNRRLETLGGVVVNTLADEALKQYFEYKVKIAEAGIKYKVEALRFRMKLHECIRKMRELRRGR